MEVWADSNHLGHTLVAAQTKVRSIDILSTLDAHFLVLGWGEQIASVNDHQKVPIILVKFYFPENFILNLRKTLNSLEHTWRKVLVRWLHWKFGSYKVFNANKGKLLTLGILIWEDSHPFTVSLSL